MKDNKFKRILVPVSLAVESTTAFKQALYFRKELGAEITLLHVTQNIGTLTKVFNSNLKSSIQGIGMVRLIRFAKMHFRGRIPEDVKLRVEIGNHVNAIKSIANSEKFDLVILNRSNNIDGLNEKFKRNSIDQIIREIKCPIISVNDRWTGRGIKNILIPIDVSRHSRDLLNWSIQLGKIFDANITLLAALTVKIELTKSLAYKKTKIMQEMIKREGITCSVVLFENEKSEKNEVLIEGAKQTKADLILIQGIQGLMFSNSNSEKLLVDFLRNSSRPIFNLGVNDESFINHFLNSSKYKSDRISNKAFKRQKTQN